MSSLPKVCVIGAGSSGLPVLKALKERGFPVTCYEKTANIGGLWCIHNKAAGATAAYDSLHINTDTRMMEVDFVPFLHALKKLRTRGRKLAKARGTRQPIIAKAS